MPPRLYIAGPMRGYPDFNYPAFRAAAARFRAVGHDVLSPVEINHGPDDPGTYPAEWYLRNDLRLLIDCTGVALLPGWEKSIGARCEVAVAVSLGMYFLDAETMQHLETPGLVHIRGGYHPCSISTHSLDLLADDIRAWQAVQFPNATPHSVTAHLLKEAKELHAFPTDPEEMADIFMLLIGAANAAGVNLPTAVEMKLEENKAREWGEPDADGVIEHVRDVQQQ